MAGSATDFLENELLDHVFGAAAYTAPATLYFAATTTAPTDSAGGTEPVGNGYARVAVTNNATNFPAASGGAKSNGTVIEWATATGSWGSIIGIDIYDAASGGNRLGYADVTSTAIGLNDKLTIPVGDLDITLT